MPKRLALVCVAGVTLVTLALAPPLVAAAGDSVVGGARDAFDANVSVSAHSGPGGESPSGHINATLPSPGSPGDTFQVRIEVTCLAVSGDLAAAGGVVTESSSNDNPAGFDFVVVFRDTGLPGGEGDAVEPFAGAPAASCADFLPAAALAPAIRTGDISITDATA